MENAGVGWIAAIIIGGIGGWLAEMFMKSNMGVLMNIILGIVGAIVANAILSLFGVVLGGWGGISHRRFRGSLHPHRHRAHAQANCLAYVVAAGRKRRSGLHSCRVVPRRRRVNGFIHENGVDGVFFKAPGKTTTPAGRVAPATRPLPGSR
jgi:uncharacterized membrane protein YeaQ/YmgE (transglycosylase-associated protein family)